MRRVSWIWHLQRRRIFVAGGLGFLALGFLAAHLFRERLIRTLLDLAAQLLFLPHSFDSPAVQADLRLLRRLSLRE